MGRGEWHVSKSELQVNSTIRHILLLKLLFTVFNASNSFSIFLILLFMHPVSICSSPSTSLLLCGCCIPFLSADFSCRGFSFLPILFWLPCPVTWWWHVLLCKYRCKTNQLSWGGGETQLGSVWLDIIRTECKTYSSCMRLGAYYILCFV